MVQAVLEERFGLKMRTEQRNVPAYALVLNRSDGRLGPQLRPAETKTCSDVTVEEARDVAIHRPDTVEELPPASKA
jgi:uncharacterized protein (TIGR03435 family)